MGKGSSQRPTDHVAYSSSFDRIFGNQKQIDEAVKDSINEYEKAQAAIRTLKRMGYVYKGGHQWVLPNNYQPSIDPFIPTLG